MAQLNLGKYSSALCVKRHRMIGGASMPEEKSKRPKSAFRLLFWPDQMIKMHEYLIGAKYPFPNMSKEKKRDFRRIAEQYKIINGHLNKLVVFRSGESGGSICKYIPRICLY